MAEPNDILHALAEGHIGSGEAADQLRALLSSTPTAANSAISALDEARTAGRLDDETYTSLKRIALEAREARDDDAGDGTVLSTEHVPSSRLHDPTFLLDGDDDAADDDRTIAMSAGDAVPGDDERTVALGSDEAMPGDDDSTFVVGAEDETIAAHPPGEEDRTLAIDAADGDAPTEVAGDRPAPGGDLDDSTHFDLSEDSETGGVSSPSSTGSTSRTSNRSWTPVDERGETIPELKGLGAGSVIKDRFVLDKVLGTGGMGKVYAARDLLKVEARDRNPRVALKVLTEDFKQHPEAFIALQREASRQQKLAHPNIATVYDFDRIGRSGTQVFITMELMEGLPLNEFIRKKVRPRGGLPFEEALPIVQGLGAALMYAHQRNIVHSDFKPGNAFLCDDGTVKVLDFGIARAVKAPGAQEGEEAEGEGEKTYFDPGKLGALTPAYASLEMLQGEDPHTSDDLYALACVAYELLTGYHPYNKKPATVAREAKMTPATIKGLTRRQMRGLLRGLAFERDRRTPDVETFLEQFEGRLNWHKNPWVIGGTMAALLALAGLNPLMGYLEEQRIEAMIAEIRTGEPAAIESALAEMPELGASARATITEEARTTFQTYFEEQLQQAVSLDQGRYDFDAAEEVVAVAQSLYPDSASVIAMSERIEALRNERLNELNQQLIAALENDRLLPGQEGDVPSVVRVLEMVAAIDPEHSMLDDPRIPDAYAASAQADINIAWLDQARQYLDVGLSLHPEDIDLINTRDRLQLAEEREARRERIQTLHARLDGASVNDMTSMAAFAEFERPIVELSRLAPDDTTLAHVSERLAPVARDEVELLIAENDNDGLGRFLQEHGTLFRATGLFDVLVTAELTLRDDAATDALASESIAALDALLEEPRLDRGWEARVRNHLGMLATLLNDDAETVRGARAAVAGFYMDEARTLESEDRHSMALAVLARADSFALDQPALAALREQIDEARIEFLREREEATRQARIEGLKDTLLIQARALDMEEATATFRELEEELEGSDPFLQITGPEAIAGGFSELAEQQAEDEDFHEAVALVDRGLEFTPGNPVLTSERQNYIVEANARDLTDLFRESDDFDTVEASRMVDEIRAYAPTRYGQLEQEYVNMLAERILDMADQSREQAERFANRASNVFPGSTVLAGLRDEVTPEPWLEGANARAALGAGRLTEARVALQSALRQHPDHPEVLNFQEDLEARIARAEAAYDRHRAAIDEGEMTAAREYLSEARSLWSDNADYRSAAASLSEQIAIQRWRDSRVLQRGMDVASLRAEAEMTGLDVITEDWQPIESNRPCTTDLAGHGRRARAICYDLIHERVRGPLMVVAPASQDQAGFAISKFEISNEDYNKYCFLSGECPVDENAEGNLPRVGLSVEDMRAYADWLSERTSKTYRLPTADEWEYAAYANGQQPPRDFNCRVMLGGQALKGTDFTAVSSGHQNGWGLKNYVGNSQELVVNDTGLQVRGGSYNDAHADCDIGLQRPHDGQPDPLTGFRLILEDVYTPEQQASR